MAQVRWSLTAGTIFRTSKTSSPEIPSSTPLLSSIESTETLLKNPLIGRVVPEFNREDIREVIFRSYRIVYLLQEDKIFILRVVHGSRDLTALAHREPWDFSS